MAIKKRITHRQTRAYLQTKLEMAENLISLLVWAKLNPVEMLTRSQRLQLGSMSRKTGLSQQAMMRRATGLWLDSEAPVYRQRYDA